MQKIRNRELSNILLGLLQKYPKGNGRIRPRDADIVLRRFYNYLSKSVTHGNREQLDLAFNSLFGQVKQGMSVVQFYNRVIEVNELLKMGNINRESELAVARLENQIRNLKIASNSPAFLEKRLDELQEEVLNLKNEKTNVQTLTSEKQDDILQKFLKSEKKAFIIMPFMKELDNVWFGAIKPACAESQIAPLRADEISLSTLITDDIEKFSNLSDVVIVDITGGNPNVMFEFGWSLAKKKKPIVICQGEYASKVAFDIKGIRHISYENTWLGIETLKSRLKEFINSTSSLIKKGVKKKAEKKKKGVK